MITAVLLSWNRLGNLSKIVEAFKKYDEITEIIIFNNNPNILAFSCEGATVINSTRDMGLWTRFSTAALAKNECILLHDDDLIAPVDTLSFLYQKWEAEQDICHATVGRKPFAGKYIARDSFGEVPMILTRCVLTSRMTCIETLKLTNFVDSLGGKLRGQNADDLTLSYVSRKLSGKMNKAYKSDCIELGSLDDNSMHRRYPEHMELRTKAMNLLEEWLIK